MFVCVGVLVRSPTFCFFFFFNDTATTEIYTLSLHDALPIYVEAPRPHPHRERHGEVPELVDEDEEREPEDRDERSEEHTSELQSQSNLVCRLLLEKKKRQTAAVHLLSNPAIALAAHVRVRSL